MAAIILAPVLVLTVLRVDAVIVYLSLCLGEVLVKFIAGDAISLVSALFPHASTLSNNSTELILLFLPVVLTIVVMFHTVSGLKVPVNLIPALCTGLLGILLVEPLLTPGMRGSLQSSSLWEHFVQAQTLIVGLSALIVLVFLWVQRRSSHHSSGHKSHSRG